MTRLHTIVHLFVAAVIFVGISKTADSADLNHEGDFGIGETQQQSTIFPASKPELFGIHRQGRSAVNLVRVLPVPHAKNNDKDNPNPGLLSEIPIQRAVSLYLYFARDIHQSLTIRELLFPFHYFL